MTGPLEPAPGRPDAGAPSPSGSTGSRELVPYVPAPPPRRAGRRAVTVLTLVLVGVLVAAGVLGARLWTTTRAWESAAAEWEQLARTHGDELAQARADVEATTGELEATRLQLATAQARITELADEKAQLGDTASVQQQLVDYQQRVSQAAGQVATALANCVDGQERLIGYLADATRYDATDVARFQAEVERVCGAATDANARLQQELAR